MIPVAAWLIEIPAEDLEGQYGGAPWAIESPDFPPDAMKAAHHRRVRERYEHAARYPWLSVEPEPTASR
jgi:hypothetical protein